MDWLQIMQTLGVPVGILMAFAFAVWQGLRWAAKYIAEPIVKRHVEFLGKVETALEQQTRTLLAVLDVQRTQEDELKKLRLLLASQTRKESQ